MSLLILSFLLILRFGVYSHSALKFTSSEVQPFDAESLRILTSSVHFPTTTSSPIYLFIYFWRKKLLFAIRRCFCHYNRFCVVRVPMFYKQDHDILVSGLAFYLLEIYSFHLRFRNIVPFWGWLSLIVPQTTTKPSPLDAVSFFLTLEARVPPTDRI